MEPERRNHGQRLEVAKGQIPGQACHPRAGGYSPYDTPRGAVTIEQELNQDHLFRFANLRSGPFLDWKIMAKNQMR